MTKKPSVTKTTAAQRKLYTSDASKYNKETTRLQDEAATYERSGRVSDAMKYKGSKKMYAEADRLQREVARRTPKSGTPSTLRKETGLSYDGGSLRRRGLSYSEFNDKGTGGPTPGDKADAKRRRENAERRSLKPITDKAVSMLRKAKGGSVSKRADGCCSKGKTKGKFM